MERAEIGALRRIDGMGNEDPLGSYIQVAVRVPGSGDNTVSLKHYRISVGNADNLRAELEALGQIVLPA